MSMYEQYVESLLKKNNIKFKKEQMFYGLKGNSNYLRFDFVIYNNDFNKILFFLEVNGEQHYKEIPNWGNFKKQLEYDRKKMSYALAYNIPLICIPYWEINSRLTYERIISEENFKVKSIWHTDRIIEQRRNEEWKH